MLPLKFASLSARKNTVFLLGLLSFEGSGAGIKSWSVREMVIVLFVVS